MSASCSGVSQTIFPPVVCKSSDSSYIDNLSELPSNILIIDQPPQSNEPIVLNDSSPLQITGSTGKDSDIGINSDATIYSEIHLPINNFGLNSPNSSKEQDIFYNSVLKRKYCRLEIEPLTLEISKQKRAKYQHLKISIGKYRPNLIPDSTYEDSDANNTKHKSIFSS